MVTTIGIDPHTATCNGPATAASDHKTPENAEVSEKSAIEVSVLMSCDAAILIPGTTFAAI
jgi:hypothetical protein